MCLPMRRTSAIRLDCRVAAISAAEDFNGSGFDPSQTDSIKSPVTRLASPRAMVSTSGSSGIATIVYSRQKVVVRNWKPARGNCRRLRTPTAVVDQFDFQRRGLMPVPLQTAQVPVPEHCLHLGSVSLRC